MLAGWDGIGLISRKDDAAVQEEEEEALHWGSSVSILLTTETCR